MAGYGRPEGQFWSAAAKRFVEGLLLELGLVPMDESLHTVIEAAIAEWRTGQGGDGGAQTAADVEGLLSAAAYEYATGQQAAIVIEVIRRSDLTLERIGPLRAPGGVVHALAIKHFKHGFPRIAPARMIDPLAMANEALAWAQIVVRCRSEVRLWLRSPEAALAINAIWNADMRSIKRAELTQAAISQIALEESLDDFDARAFGSKIIERLRLGDEQLKALGEFLVSEAGLRIVKAQVRGGHLPAPFGKDDITSEVFLELRRWMLHRGGSFEEPLNEAALVTHATKRFVKRLWSRPRREEPLAPEEAELGVYRDLAAEWSAEEMYLWDYDRHVFVKAYLRAVQEDLAAGRITPRLARALLLLLAYFQGGEDHGDE